MRVAGRGKAFLWAAGIASVTALAAWLGWEEIGEGLLRLGVPALLALGMLQVLTLLLLGTQWHLLLRRLGAANSYLDQVAVTLAANFVESVTPSVKLGGEAARFWLLRHRTGVDVQGLSGAFLAQKAMSLVPLFLVLTVVLGGAAGQGILPRVLVPCLLTVIGLGAFLYWLGTAGGSAAIASPGRGWLQQAASFVIRARRESARLLEPSTRIWLLGLALAMWLLYPLKVFLVAEGLGTPIGFFPAAVALFGAYLVNLLPLLPGGLGTFEATLAGLLALTVGLTWDQGLLVALVTRLGTFWFPFFLSALAAGYLALVPGGVKAEGAPVNEHGGESAKIARIFSGLTGLGEYMLALLPTLAHLYDRLFYRRMVQGEIALAGLQPGDRVLHVGCGALPLTTLALARQGLRVVALDLDPGAVRRARNIMNGSAGDLAVEVRLQDGQEVDASGFQAVWVSFHAQPRGKILSSLLQTMDPGARLIYRNSRDWLSAFYPAVEPEQLPGNRVAGRWREGLGKEIVVLERIPVVAADSQAS